MKHRVTESTLNKHQVLQWINSILKGNETKIESLGTGIVYCMLMNHYYPNSIPHNKIIMMPRNNMDNKANLKKVQEALIMQNIKSINFDIFRVSEMSYLDNWQLICKFYKHFEEISKNAEKETEKLNHQSESQQMINTIQSIVIPQNSVITQNNMMTQPQMNFIIPKEVPKTYEFTTGLLTPMKGLKFFEENTKLRYEALKLMEEIKSIVKLETESDKTKVKILKKMLGLIEEESQEEELEMKELFSECKKKQEIITID